MNSTEKPDTRAEIAQQCVRCGACLPHCPTYQLTQSETESPRGRIAIMAEMAISPNKFPQSPPGIDNCLSCRRCESVCPAGVSYESLLVQTRAQHPPKLKMSSRIVLHFLAHKPLLNIALTTYRNAYPAIPNAIKQLPKPPEYVCEISISSSKTAIFRGCVSDIYEQNTRQSLLKILRSIGENVEIPSQQTCCGQAHLHAGYTQRAGKLAQENTRALQPFERALTLASGCVSALQNTLNIPVIDACEYLWQKREQLKFRSANGLCVALHMPCTASFNKQQRTTRELLECIPDLMIIDLPDTGCCGAAGLHQLEKPERAAQLREPILREFHQHTASHLLSQNIGCRLHFANATALPVLHPIEFMAQFIHGA